MCYIGLKKETGCFMDANTHMNKKGIAARLLLVLVLMFCALSAAPNSAIASSATSKLSQDTAKSKVLKKGYKQIKFKVNGGKTLAKSKATKVVKKGKKIGKLPKPKRAGYKFLGWYTKKVGGTKVTKATRLKTNKTVWAHWRKATVIKPKPNSPVATKGEQPTADGTYDGQVVNGWVWVASTTKTETIKGSTTVYTGFDSVSTPFALVICDTPEKYEYFVNRKGLEGMTLICGDGIYLEVPAQMSAQWYYATSESSSDAFLLQILNDQSDTSTFSSTISQFSYQTEIVVSGHWV
jgi:hypothetical protein